MNNMEYAHFNLLNLIHTHLSDHKTRINPISIFVFTGFGVVVHADLMPAKLGRRRHKLKPRMAETWVTSSLQELV